MGEIQKGERKQHPVKIKSLMKIPYLLSKSVGPL
jgi:hypothetical protein